MLFIYSAMHLGGIETFILRMAKTRKEQGKSTCLLLVSRQKYSNPLLLAEVKKYARVYFLSEVVSLRLPFLSLIQNVVKLNNKKIKDFFYDTKHIHVANGVNCILAIRISKILSNSSKITVGVYHPQEFFWGDRTRLPYFEKINRRIVFEMLPKPNLYLFGKNNLDHYSRVNNIDLSGASTFRIGVVKSSLNTSSRNTHYRAKLKICSVGRLVDFKTYNKWMIEVVLELLQLGYDVQYDIYGRGPNEGFLHSTVNNSPYPKNIRLCGDLPYKDFDVVVNEYDLFVGSGTSIIQASALGVPSIIGIDSIEKPETYGFFSMNANIDFNINQDNYPKVGYFKILIDFINLSAMERQLLSIEHKKAAKDFDMALCNNNFEISGIICDFDLKYRRFQYVLSRVCTIILASLRIKLDYADRYKSS